MDLPLYFPTDINRRLVGLGQRQYRKKFSVVFQDYGRCGHVDVRHVDNHPVNDSSGSQTVANFAQRQHHKQRDRSVLCACVPTLPLSETPVEVHSPPRDVVIGNLPDLPAKVTRFSRGLVQVSAALRQEAMWSKPFLRAKKTLDKIITSDSTLDFDLEAIEGSLAPSIANLVTMYAELSQQPSFHAYNPHYSGGLVSCVTGTSGGSLRHLLFHARGRKLDQLALTIAGPSSSHLMPSRLVSGRPVKKLFQVHAAAVQDHVFIAARHKTSCSVFSISQEQCMDVSLAVDGDEVEKCSDIDSTSYLSQHTYNGPVLSNKAIQLAPLGRCCFEEGQAPTSVCVSPYLPGEGLFCTDTGIVKLWSASQDVLRTIEKQPRFECRDSWRHAYYAGHPRQMVLADRTAVQMMDHNDGFHSSVDLFALPSPLVHRKECIMAAHPYGNGSPLHVVATCHCLFMIDQRFAGSPVMQWYPDLEGPIQYLASTEYYANNEERRGVVLAGCQYPAEVMCYPFNHGSGCPVTMSLSPWRLSKMSDIGDNQRYSCFHRTIDPLLLEERLRMSLAGLAVARGSKPDSFVAYQADCYGELFCQQYANPDDPRTAVKTGVPPPGKRDHYVPADVQNHVSSWLECLQKQVISVKNAQKKEVQEGRRLSGSQILALKNEENHSSAETTSKRCSHCKDTVDLSSAIHHGKNELLCLNCHNFYHHFRAKDKQCHQILHSSLPLSGGDVADSRFVTDDVSVRMLLLDKAVPSVDSYETDSFTNVYLELMNPDPQPLELVRKREEKHSQLLEDLKSKKRRICERRKQKRKADEDIHESVEDTGTTPQHSVFNTAEHQQRNAYIFDVLSKMAKPEKPVTVSLYAAEDTMSAISDGENTPPSFDSGELISDLFDNSEEKKTVEKSQHLSQDDDDEFFGSQDLFKPIPASPRLNLSQNSVPFSPALTPVPTLLSSPPVTKKLLTSEADFVTRFMDTSMASPSAVFPPSSSLGPTPQSLKLRTSNVSPCPSVSTSAEKRKSKSAKKHRLSLGGFC